VSNFRQLALGKRKIRLIRLLSAGTPGIKLTERTYVDGAAVFRRPVSGLIKWSGNGRTSKQLLACG
jgi:hypothetical protein